MRTSPWGDSAGTDACAACGTGADFWRPERTQKNDGIATASAKAASAYGIHGREPGVPEAGNSTPGGADSAPTGFAAISENAATASGIAAASDAAGGWSAFDRRTNCGT